MSARRTVSQIADDLVARVGAEALADLATEDIVAAAELHFDPVLLRELPELPRDIGSECSTDGYYEAQLDPERPWIIYASALSERRTRFTIVHEVGHHLLASDACDLIDDIDRLAGKRGGVQQIEERVCHAFAGRVLVPAATVESVLGAAKQLVPDHIERIHQETQASYEACAIRAVELAPRPTVVVLMRSEGHVGFSVASPSVEGGWWPRGSPVRTDGPLDRAFSGDRTALRDVYRHGLAYEQQLFCDTMVAGSGSLVIAVMTRTRSDGQWDLLEELEPSWRTSERFCSFDNDELDVGWCDRCRGRRCRTCDRCSCDQPQPMHLCPGCELPAPINPGNKYCNSCVLDGRIE